jgi:hypothetical protein
MGSASFDYTEVEVLNSSGDSVFTGFFRENGRSLFALYLAREADIKSDAVLTAVKAADASNGVDGFVAGIMESGLPARISLCSGKSWPPKIADGVTGIYSREDSDWVCVA